MNKTNISKFYTVSRKVAAIISGICAIVLAAVCIYLYMNDTVIPGEGQDPIVSWIFMSSFGMFGCGVFCLILLYESLSRSNKRDLLIFGLAYIFVALSLSCGIILLKTLQNYGPQQGVQTYLVEEADFMITFPRGLTPVEETSDGGDYRKLYAFSKAKAISVHIRAGWKPEAWTDSDFHEYVTKVFYVIFNKEVFDKATVIHFDDFDAIRMVGRTDNDGISEFRAIYDILYGNTYIRVVVSSNSLSGHPGQSFFSDCDQIVSSIRFSDRTL